MNHILPWVIASIRCACWAPILVLVVHVVASVGFHAYRVWPDFDVPMHFAGGAAMAYFIWMSLSMESAELVLGSPSAFGKWLLAFASVSTVTVLWEFAEWALDWIASAKFQVGLDDTLFDMLIGMLGGTIYLCIAQMRSTRPGSR